jgi:hypothetical protein
MNNNFEFLKQTEDNWCGSYKMDGELFVKVKFGWTGPNPKIGQGQYRVGVWGNDDFGMIKDFNTESDCVNMLMEVIQLPLVNIELLETLGFETF